MANETRDNTRENHQQDTEYGATATYLTVKNGETPPNATDIRGAMENIVRGHHNVEKQRTQREDNQPPYGAQPEVQGDCNHCEGCATTIWGTATRAQRRTQAASERTDRQRLPRVVKTRSDMRVS